MTDFEVGGHVKFAGGREEITKTEAGQMAAISIHVYTLTPPHGERK